MSNRYNHHRAARETTENTPGRRSRLSGRVGSSKWMDFQARAELSTIHTTRRPPKRQQARGPWAATVGNRPRGAFFITFASVTPIPVRRRTKIFVFIIFNQNFECRPSPHTHTLSRSLGRWRYRREMYGFPMIFELGVRLRRLFMTLDGPLHS